GGGVGAVSYSIAAGPISMTIDATSGAVSFAAGATPATYTVAIAATGGGAIIYQVFSLQVISPLLSLISPLLPVRDGDTAGGMSWVAQIGFLHRLTPDGTDHPLVALPRYSGHATSLSLSNGAPITGLSYLGGTVTSLQAPL